MLQNGFEALSLCHRDAYLSFPVTSPNSKFSFAQGFMWQEQYGTEICLRDNYLLFRARPDGSPCFVSPILRSDADIVPAMEEMLALCPDFCMRYVCPEIKVAIEKYFPGRFLFIPDRDNSEYVYSTQSLITLAGKKLHQKRNHINAFERQHEYGFVPYEPRYFRQCMLLQQKWLDGSPSGDAAESAAIEKALLNYDALQLRAGVILQSGEVTAFSIGEKTGSDCAVILIEKALPEYNGLFQVINRDTVRHLFADTEYINRCEDMGIEGMRKAKLSYQPCLMVDKYTCVPAKQR